MGLISIAAQATGRWYSAEILRGATERIEAAGHTALVHAIPLSDTSTAEAAAAIEADFAGHDSLGAVAAGFKYRAEHSTKALSWKRPIVAIGGSVLGFPTVMIDDIGAARIATGHLIDLGHTRITHLTEPLQSQADFLVFGRRVRGYRSAMESAGLEPVVVDIEREFDEASALESARALLEGPSRPTAVFAASDELAFAVLAAARDLGLRPGHDLSVVGFDDQPRAEAEDLTTMRQHPAEIGSAAVDLLLDGLAAGPDPKQSRLQPVTFVKRGSTGRPAAS
jgi:LacI family repressor for deo operon, udp, cdd, tsx, nupC, and nupG